MFQVFRKDVRPNTNLITSFSGFQISKPMQEVAFYFIFLMKYGCGIVTMPTVASIVLHVVGIQAGAERQLLKSTPRE